MLGAALWWRARWSRSHILLAGIIMIALGLRLYGLGTKSLWLDEIGQARVARADLVGILRGVRAHHGAQPLDYLITAVVLRVSPYEWVLRLPAALWGSLSVYLLYRLGKSMHSERTGLVAAVLLSVHPLHIRYSQELRFYSLFVFLVLLATLTLRRAWHVRHWRGWLLYGLVLTLGLFTHIYMVLVTLYHGIWGWARAGRGLSSEGRGLFTRWVATVFASGILFSPWIMYSVIRERPVSVFRPPALSWTLLRKVADQFSGQSSFLVYVWLMLFVVGLAVLTVTRLDDGLLLGGWILVSLPIILVVDRMYSYFFHIRQFLFALPAFLLLVSVGLVWAVEQLGKGIRRYWGVGMGGTGLTVLWSLFLVAFMVPQVQRHYQAPRIDWRGIGALFTDNLSLGDTTVLFNVASYVEYYSPRAARQSKSAHDLNDLRRIYDEGRPLWVLITPYLRLQVSDHKAIRNWLKETPALRFPFGLGSEVYYLQKGKSHNELAAVASHFALPLNRQALEAYARAMQWYGVPLRAAETYALLAERFGSGEQGAEYLYLAGEQFALAGKRLLARTLWQRYLRQYPDGQRAAIIKERLPTLEK